MKTIQLTRGMVAMVDDEDYQWLNQWKWNAHKNGRCFYAVRTLSIGKPKMIKMHRVILNAPAGMMCDHKDGNGLNNQRKNLRLATHSQNQRNRRSFIGVSSFKGVYVDRGKWRAQIWANNKRIHVGYFATEHEAAAAYNAAAIIHHGEFAKLNHIIF